MDNFKCFSKKLFEGVLTGYRQHLLPITRAPTVGVTDVRNLFDRDTFLRSRERAFHPFYE